MKEERKQNQKRETRKHPRREKKERRVQPAHQAKYTTSRQKKEGGEALKTVTKRPKGKTKEALSRPQTHENYEPGNQQQAPCRCSEHQKSRKQKKKVSIAEGPQRKHRSQQKMNEESRRATRPKKKRRKPH
jgi:hypothetical protein